MALGRWGEKTSPSFPAPDIPDVGVQVRKLSN